MDFRLELHIKPWEKQLNIRDRVMLIGSCFTEHMSRQLQKHKFQILENPNGILFNPASIAKAVENYISLKQYRDDELFLYNELWTSWDYHSRFSNPDKKQCLNEINNSVNAAHNFLKNADWLIVTLGSSFVYKLRNESYGGKVGAVAANCHKVPAPHFDHQLLSYAAVLDQLHQIVRKTIDFNAGLKIIFTISPVRHSREGLVENNRSKALLHTAVYEMEQQYENLFYFPAYELVIDDLRDYRFYAEDMVHPNYQATQYVWEKFSESAIDKESREIMKQLLSIYHAKNHKPLHEDSQQHRAFLASMYEKVTNIAKAYPFLDMNEELEYFRGNASNQ